MKKLTVGRLRQLIKNLPDDAPIFPDWTKGATPSEDEPGVSIDSIAVGKDKEHGKYLSVRVSLFYLNDEDPDDQDTQN